MLYICIIFVNNLDWLLLYMRLVLLGAFYVISYLEGNKDNPKGIVLSKKLFETSSSFNIAAMVICIITAFLYAFLW